VSAEKLDFTGVEWGSVEWTNLGTLYLRAYESRSGGPILGDHFAAEAVERIDYDFDRIRRRTNPAGNQFLVALRAKQFDVWAADFLAHHPDAVVLHLACGLDSRAFRVHPPAGVDWFDLDLPGVIELRRRLYSERDHYRMIGASVTDPGWLEELPADRPALVVAEGLLMYLEEHDVRRLLQRLTDHFGGGELLFDASVPWAVRLLKIYRWGIRDARQLERWNPRLRYVEETSPMAHYAEIPVRIQRLVFRVCNAIPATRTFNRQFRFRF
jgi:methyltransferase (TIGR00027 family)